MGFWEKDFLDRRRQEWMSSIHKFQYMEIGMMPKSIVRKSQATRLFLL